MNNVTRRIWIMAGSFIALTLIAYLYFYFADMQSMPVNFWIIPVFFLLLTLVLGLIAKKYISDKKDMSIGSILGIRVFFISLIAIVLILNILIDRAHILPLAVLYVIFGLGFSFFETQILLKLNKKDY